MSEATAPIAQDRMARARRGGHLLSRLSVSLGGGTRRPDEPPLVKGRVPWLGCGIDFGKDAGSFLADCRRRHGDVFTAHIAGQRMTFVLDVHSYPAVLRLQEDLLFQPIAVEVSARAFGHTEAAYRRVGEMMEFYPRHLKTSTLGPVAAGMHEQLERYFDTASGPEWREASLPEFTSRAMFLAGMGALFGDGVYSEERERDFRRLDALFPLLVAGVPARLLGIDRTRRALATLFERQWPRGSAFIRERMEHMEPLVGPVQSSRMQLAMAWASLSNTISAAFWALAFLLADPRARAAVEEEVLGVAAAGPDPARVRFDPEPLRLMPRLQSSVSESLRLSSASITIREAARDFTMTLESGARFAIRAGDRVCLYPYLSHRDPEIFPDPERYLFDRFLDDGGRPRQFHKGGRKVTMALMPFGGGESMCPGRFVANLEMMQLCAFALHRLDMELIGDLPAFDHRRAGLGILPPRGDVRFRYRRRVRQ